jgi:hypothetical protein
VAFMYGIECAAKKADIHRIRRWSRLARPAEKLRFSATRIADQSKTTDSSFLPR